MSAVATSPDPGALGAERLPENAAPRLFESGEISLEQRVLGAWRGLTRDGAADCVVCGGRLGRGGCEDCGSELS